MEALRPFVAGPLCFRSDLARQVATEFGAGSDTRGENEKRRERKLSGVVGEYGVSIYAHSYHSSYSPTGPKSMTFMKNYRSVPFEIGVIRALSNTADILHHRWVELTF